MNVQGYQKMTLLDYPTKVACTIFTGGCNLRCPFCHNASLVNHPSENENAESEVLAYLEKRRGILDGVCITGGEPLLQPDLIDFIRKVKDLGLSVKLDTNGTLPDRLKTLIESGMLDYIAMDVKSSPEGYEKAVGVKIDVALIEKSIKLIKESGIAHEFRTTVVKGIHEKEDFEGIARLVSDSPYFLQGFIDSGNLIGDGCEAFSPEEMQEILNIAKNSAPLATLRGQEEI